MFGSGNTFVNKLHTKEASQQLIAIDGPSAIDPFIPDHIIENMLKDGNTASFPFRTLVVHFINIPNKRRNVIDATVQKAPSLPSENK